MKKKFAIIPITLCAMLAALTLGACRNVAENTDDSSKALWEPSPEADKIVVISDIHLGIDDSFAEIVENKPILIDFLKRLQKTKDVRELVIAGDFLDEWYLALDYPAYPDSSDFYRKVIANNKDVFDELKNVMASGIKLVYVVGNHDMLLESGVLEEALPGIVQARDSKGLGVYYTGNRKEIAIEHCHRYDVFSAPDTITNKELAGGETTLPPGYFFARMAASWVIQGRPDIQRDYPVITTVPDKNTDPDQYGAYLYHKVLGSALSAVTPNEGFADKVLGMDIDGYHGHYSIEDLYPVLDADGSINAPVLYKNFQRTWDERQQINNVKVKNSFTQAVAGALDTGFYFEQAKAQYLENPDENISVVVFGHTHIPVFEKMENGKFYINDGTWIDHNSNAPYMRTFAVVTTGETNNAALYTYNADGTLTDISIKEK